MEDVSLSKGKWHRDMMSVKFYNLHVRLPHSIRPSERDLFTECERDFYNTLKINPVASEGNFSQVPFLHSIPLNKRGGAWERWRSHCWILSWMKMIFLERRWVIREQIPLDGEDRTVSALCRKIPFNPKTVFRVPNTCRFENSHPQAMLQNGLFRCFPNIKC